MGLQNEEKKLALEYSHGMRKKLALAAALLPTPNCSFSTSHYEGVRCRCFTRPAGHFKAGCGAGRPRSS